jgi:DivIVA domain-containing protein
MEMSPKAIAAVTFPVVRKGYDPEQVRSFLSQLSRGVEELQNRALQAEAKARLTTAAPAHEPDAANVESITKTLLLAQRTADATLAEARQEAEGIRRQASERAESILAEAKAQGAQLVTAAEQDALRAGEGTRARLAAEVDVLETRRQALSEDVDALSTHISGQRERMAATAEALRRALEQPEGLQEVPRPVLSTPPAPQLPDEAGYVPVTGAGAELSPTQAVPWASEGGGGGGGGDAASVGVSLPAPAPPAESGDPPSVSAGGNDPRDPITQEVPTVGDQAWSFFDDEPKSDDRWKR